MSATHTKGTAAQQAAALPQLAALTTWQHNGFLLAQVKGSRPSAKRAATAVRQAGFGVAFAGAMLAGEGWVIVCFPL